MITHCEWLSACEQEFAALYSPIGRPSIPPEKLLPAILVQVFLSCCSAGSSESASTTPFQDHSDFSKDRDPLLEGDMAVKCLTGVGTA